MTDDNVTQLSPLPTRDKPETDTEPPEHGTWEVDLIPVTFGDGPLRISDGWEPMQVTVGTDGGTYLLTRRML